MNFGRLVSWGQMGEPQAREGGPQTGTLSAQTTGAFQARATPLAPSQITLTHKPEKTAPPPPQALAAPTSIPLRTALHLHHQTGCFYLSGKGAGASECLPASCSWQLSNYFLSWSPPATGTQAGATRNNCP